MEEQDSPGNVSQVGKAGLPPLSIALTLARTEMLVAWH
jgi:hypothetical protein